MDAGPLEKIYVVLAGEVTRGAGGWHRARPARSDSCHIPGGEARAVRNAGNRSPRCSSSCRIRRSARDASRRSISRGLFDVRGKSAIVIGATGAFGKVACATLGRAGARLTIAAGNAAELDGAGAGIVRRRRCRCARFARRPNTRSRFARPSSSRAVGAFGGVDILVVASGMNDVSPIVDMAPERFSTRSCRRIVDGSLAHRAGRGTHMIAQGRGGKVVFTSSARGKLGHPAGYSAYCASKSAVDGHDQGAGLRMGQVRHHGQRHRAHGVPLAADGLDVRGQRQGEQGPRRLSGARAARPAGRAGGPRGPAAVSVLARLGLSYRPHRLRRRRLYRRLAMMIAAAIHCDRRRRPHGRGHRPGVRRRRAIEVTVFEPSAAARDTVRERIAADLRLLQRDETLAEAVVTSPTILAQAVARRATT